MALYRVVERSFVGGAIREAGDVVEYVPGPDGTVSKNLAPLSDDEKADVARNAPEPVAPVFSVDHSAAMEKLGAVPPSNIAEMDKDALEAFAKAKFGADLDKRRSIERLRAEVAAMMEGV